MNSITFLKTSATFSAIVSIVLFTALTSWSENSIVLPNGAKAEIKGKCPVCGMLVGGRLGGNAGYSYLDGRLIGFSGVAAALLKNDQVKFFEGARCLFIFNTAAGRFGISADDIRGTFVTDFTSRKMVEVQDARFVIGSRVKGPMGYDLIPFIDKKAADSFASEYGGKRIVRMGTIGLKDVDRDKTGNDK